MTHSPKNLAPALARLERAARAAGAVAAADFRLGAHTSAHVTFKEGGSPVTDADLRANDALHAMLTADFPGAGWLSEETADDPARLARNEVLIVDPIDGTRAFLTGDARWAVSVALVRDGRAMAGAVFAPALDEMFTAAHGLGAWRNGIAISATTRVTLDGARAAGPKPSVERLARAAGAMIENVGRVPSLALRLAQVAEGRIDFALANENSNEWDIAAADILLQESGAALFDASGAPIRYNGALTKQSALYAAPVLLAPALKRAAGIGAGDARRV